MIDGPTPHPVADRVRSLRLAGNLTEAVQEASVAIAANPRDWDVIGESICTLICMGQGETAARLYQTFTSDPTQNNNLRPEILVRLALQLERRDLLEGMVPPERPSWLVSLLTTGDDPEEFLVVLDVQVTVDNGPSVFTFLGSCPHCGHSLKQEFRTTLLVHRVWVCTSCFGAVKLDYQIARKALREKFSDRFGGDIYQKDSGLIQRIKPKITGEDNTPFVVRALAQEYHFLLNEILLKMPVSTAGSGPKT